MALTEKTEASRCDVLEDLSIIARMVLVIKRDGTEISREKIAPLVFAKDSDVSSAPDRVKALAAKLW